MCKCLKQAMQGADAWRAMRGLAVKGIHCHCVLGLACVP